jgi:hypothetical protein
VSDGDPGPGGILGEKIPRLFERGSDWRWFYTRQHGDNVTFEVVVHRPQPPSGPVVLSRSIDQ